MRRNLLDDVFHPRHQAEADLVERVLREGFWVQRDPGNRGARIIRIDTRRAR